VRVVAAADLLAADPDRLHAFAAPHYPVGGSNSAHDGTVVQR
jgi:hypothetical protein